MQLYLRISIHKKGGVCSEWTSPLFDTADSSTWPGKLQPVAELLDIPSDGVVVFALMGDRRIVDDPSWATKFRINGYQNVVPSMSYNSSGVFEFQGKSEVTFFERAAPGTFVRLGIASGKDKDGNGKYDPVLEIPASVIDCSGRRSLYLKMLEEVLSVNPGLAMPDDDRMATPRFFDIVFPECLNGDSGVSSELLQYRDLRRDLDSLIFGNAPLLRAIEIRPVTSQSQSQRFISFRKVRRITSRHLNEIRLRGIDDRDVEADNCVVTEDIFAESKDSTANRAIRSFLDDVLRELSALKSSFDQQHDLYLGEKKRNPKIVGQRYDQRITSLRNMSEDILEASRKLRRYINTSNMWSSTAGGTMVFAKCARLEDFSATPEYLRVYWIIRRHYMRKYWLKTEEGSWFVADYKVHDNPEGMERQRSFNFLFESWVFVRLLRSFSKNGYRLLDAYTLLLEKVQDVFMGLDVNESVSAEARSGDLRVGVTYGVTEKFSENPMTPDFAIEIENMRTHQTHVIIVDAKAVEKLGKNSIEQRDKYLRMTWDRPQNFPNQSWLVYLGDIDQGSGARAAIEFSKGEGLSLQNLGLKWAGRNGIVGAWTNQTSPVGHLRANWNSISAGNDIFDEFVVGQLATARRHL